MRLTPMVIAALGALAVTGALAADAAKPAAAPIAPVSIARDGFAPKDTYLYLKNYSYEEVLKSGDVALFFLLNANNKLFTATIPRSGNVVMLNKRLDASIGGVKVKGEFGELPLSQFLADPRSRAQSVIVIHQGNVVFEEYPGMRDFDSHVWMSVTKTVPALLLGQLAEEGKLDVKRPIDSYLPQLRGSDWAGIPVQDVLDMATGLDNVETQEARLNPRSVIARHNYAANGVPNADGKIESAMDVILASRRVKAPGQAFDYSSVNTVLLGLLAEAIENKRWTEIFRERVWSKMTGEGDALMNVASDGVAHVEGMMMTRLRDLGRYGMLYTRSWRMAAREKVVPDAYLRRITADARKDIYLKGELGTRMVEKYFPASPPMANSWQWDAIFADGDMYKAGTMGQGLYVSTRKDLVVAWFSTRLFTDLTQYARAIALKYTQPKR